MTESEYSARYKWLAFTAVSVGVFMSTLDASIVNIALPNIRQAFDADFPTVQWVVMSYLLAITSVLLTLGRLGDMIGRKTMYLIGMAVFTLGSIACGASATISILILSRALQGLGAAMIMAMGPAITTSSFPASERGKALGMIGTVVAVGLTFGPAIGGYIIRYLGWRWIFFVNVPVGVIGAFIIHRFLRESEITRDEKFDLTGAAMLFVALGSMLLALSYGREWGWTSVRTLSLISVFAVFGVVFIWWEGKALNPILHLELFRNRAFTLASISAWISFVALFAVAVYMPFYLRQVLQLSAVATGQLLMLVPAAVSFIAPISGWLSDRLGTRMLSSIGMAMISVGLVALSRLGISEPLWDVAWRLMLTGVGSGIFQSPNSSAIMGSAPRKMLGVASGMVAMVRNFGMVSGVAIIGAIVSSGQARYLAGVGAVDAEASRAALVYGLGHGFLAAAGITAIGVIISAARRSESPQNGG